MAERGVQRFQRLLLLVPYLIQHPDASVPEVCERFGIDRKQLTADIDLLSVCGLPGYGPEHLIDATISGDEIMIRAADYFSRPLRLSMAEGLLLHAAAKVLVTEDNSPLDRAMDRLEQVIPKEIIEAVHVEGAEVTGLGEIRAALDASRRLRIVYLSVSKEEETDRVIDPWQLFFGLGSWYLAAWCHMVKGERIFRVDRMKSIELLDETFDRPDVDGSRYEGVYVPGAGTIEVTLELAPEAAGWVTDYYATEEVQRLDDGWTRVRMKIGGQARLERLVLSLGGRVRVTSPKEVADRIRELACSILERYS